MALLLMSFTPFIAVNKEYLAEKNYYQIGLHGFIPSAILCEVFI